MTEFEKLFQEKQPLVFRFLVKLSGDPVLSEELTQEAFFRAYMNYAGLRDKEKATTWLCQIAKNVYYAWCGEQKKHASLVQDVADGEDLETAFLQKELSQKALACLHTLEEPYKEVFLLSVYGGFSLKEISTVFGKSESWARVTFYRARQKLQERMNQLS